MTDVTQAIVELYVPCGAVCILCDHPHRTAAQMRPREARSVRAQEEKGRPRSAQAERSRCPGRRRRRRAKGRTHDFDEVKRLTDLHLEGAGTGVSALQRQSARDSGGRVRTRTWVG